MGGDREISILLPNKYLVEDAMNAGGLSTAMINTRGLNGDKAWSGNSGGGGGMIFRMGGPGGQQASPEQMEAMLRRIYNAEFSRYLLAMILTPPPSLAVEYKYAGESDVEDAEGGRDRRQWSDNFAVARFLRQEESPAFAAELSWTKATRRDDDTPGRQRCQTRRDQEGP